MPDRRRLFLTLSAMFLVLLLGTGIYLQAQAPQDRLIIQAMAKGTSTQMGRMQAINIYINELSTPEDQKMLIDAFQSKGQDGLINALGKMKSKGRINIPSRTGNDIKYIREFPAEGGARRFRLVTDRTIAFGEALANTRSKDYGIGVIDLTISADGKEGSGTMLPATKLKVNDKKELEVETYQFPWKLENFTVTKKSDK